MTLLSLASKQIWPQVLLVAHIKPKQLILLHSADSSESQGPAQRLKRLVDKTGLLPLGQTRMELMSDNDFHAAEQQLDQLLLKRQLHLAECLLNFTGGNKLMATAAFRWAARRGVRSCYLERRHLLTWFTPHDGEINTRTETINAHITNFLDPVALLRCQLEVSEVEHAGQTLSLTPQARACEISHFFNCIQNGLDPTPWLQVSGTTANTPQAGDHLELATAAVLLKLGVPVVQRGLRLRVRSAAHVSTRLPHAEIDLLFNWAGRLWLVDCKDRRAPEDFVQKLLRELPRPLTANAQALLDRIASELTIGQTKALKEDLLAIHETGGLLGQILCVRKSKLPPEVEQYAMRNRINVVYKSDLTSSLSKIIKPT